MATFTHPEPIDDGTITITGLPAFEPAECIALDGTVTVPDAAVQAYLAAWPTATRHATPATPTEPTPAAKAATK